MQSSQHLEQVAGIDLNKKNIREMTIERVGVLWFTRVNYDRAIALSEDRMPDTYEVWQGGMEQTISYLAAYLPVIKIEIEPEEHLLWCRKMGKKVDTKSRAAFAAWYINRGTQH